MWGSFRLPTNLEVLHDETSKIAITLGFNRKPSKPWKKRTTTGKLGIPVLDPSAELSLQPTPRNRIAITKTTKDLRIDAFVLWVQDNVEGQFATTDGNHACDRRHSIFQIESEYSTSSCIAPGVDTKPPVFSW